MQNRGTGPIPTPEEKAEEARLQAEADRLRGELEQITGKVTQVSAQTRQALCDLIEDNQARLAFLQAQLADLQPLDGEMEAVPPSPYTEVLMEKLDASKALCEAGIRLVELQLAELNQNLETLQGEPSPEASFADISEAPEYLLAKAESDVAAARLKLADFMLPMGILEWYFAPTRRDVDDPLVNRIKAFLDQDKKIKVDMNLALSTYKESLDLVAEGKKVVRGIRQFDWSLDLIHEFGDKVWGKLKGKLHHLERLPDQLEETPLSAIFLKPEPSEPLPYQREHAWLTPAVHTPSGTGRLKETGKLGQTGNLAKTGNLGGTGRLINRNG